MWRRALVKNITLSLFIALSASPGSAASKVGDGLACTKIKQVKKIQGIRYACSKAGKKLVWIANKADLQAKADAESKAKVDAEAKAKVDAEAKRNADLATEKNRYLQNLRVSIFNKPKEADFSDQLSYLQADYRWWGWKWNLIGKFEDRARIPGSVQVVFQSPDSSGFSQEVIAQNQIKCLKAVFKEKSFQWSYNPTNITCTPLGNQLYQLNIDNLEYNVAYLFELSWELTDGSQGPTFWPWTVIGRGAFNSVDPYCNNFSCIVSSYR